VTDMQISEIVTLVTVVVAIGGSLYAVRRQGDTQAVSSNADLRERVTYLENANRYLIAEMARLERDNGRLVEQVQLLAEELRDWKRRFELKSEENAALSRALGSNR